jgi:hypothetical protein
MKNKWYINRISFRIFLPAVAGIILYLAMLMVFGNLESLSETFFSQEALFLVIITYLNHEWALFLLGRAGSRKALESSLPLPKLVYYLFLISGTIILSSIITLFYFILFLGYYYYTTELITINLLMVLFQLMVHLYYISMQNIRHTHELSIEEEDMLNRQLELELESFKSEMNPDLLLECLENLLTLMYKDVQASDHYIKALSNQYRYMLDGRKDEFIIFDKELIAAQELLYLLNKGGDARISLEHETVDGDLYLIPGTLHNILYTIEHNFILSTLDPLLIVLSRDDEGNIWLRHPNRPRLVPGRGISTDKLNRSYIHYTGKGIYRHEKGTWMEWMIPCLPEIIK